MADAGALPQLGRILKSSPYWDMRMYAAASLGRMGSTDADAVLAETEKAEPLYFVRHWIAAARLNCRRSQGRVSH